MNPFANEHVQLMLYLGILKAKESFEDLTTPTKVETINEVIDQAALEYIWDAVRPFIRENIVSRDEFMSGAKYILNAQGVTVNDIVKQINANRDEIIRILRNNGIDI